MICYNNIYLSSNCVERLRGDCLAKIKDLKIENIDKVKECFYNTQIWTKNELSLKTGISKAGITNILKILLKKQLISYIGEAHSTGGRKSKQYQNPNNLQSSRRRCRTASDKHQQHQTSRYKFTHITYLQIITRRRNDGN